MEQTNTNLKSNPCIDGEKREPSNLTLLEIRTFTQEGKLLMAALAILTISPKIGIHKTEINGRLQTPETMLSLLEGAARVMYDDYDKQNKSEPVTLEQEIAQVINKRSLENCSNTPDFVLAKYLVGCLQVFNNATNERQQWHGCKKDFLE